MRTLPENPSLHYLRQEAKDLLAALRQAQPTATLAAAQRALADQYGFRSWTDLKAEVERRRGVEETADPEVAREIAAAFGLGHPMGPMVHVSRDNMGGTWSLQTDTGEWSLRPVFDWIDDAQAETAVRLMRAAAEAGIRTPEPVRSVAGRLVEQTGGRSWRADVWMNLGPSPAKPVSTAVASNVGRTLGVLHKLALPATGTDAPRARPSAGDWQRALSWARSSGANWASMLEHAIPALVDLASVAARANDDARVILCQRGLSPSNVRFGHGGELVLMHWEFAGPQSARAELGDVIAQWTMGPGDHVNVAAAQALADAYSAQAGTIAPVDLAMFSPSISGYLWWTSNRVLRALDGRDREQQELAVRELPSLLAPPRSRARYERLVDALGRAVVA